MAIKVLHERWKCIGCTSCVAVDPDRWVMAADNIADLKGSKHTQVPEGIKEEAEFEDDGRSQEAADLCPVNCIHVTKKEAKK